MTVWTVQARIIDTPHGPEIQLLSAFSIVATYTVAEWEKFAVDAVALGREARARLNAHHRRKKAPL